MEGKLAGWRKGQALFVQVLIHCGAQPTKMVSKSHKSVTREMRRNGLGARHRWLEEVVAGYSEFCHWETFETVELVVISVTKSSVLFNFVF